AANSFEDNALGKRKSNFNGHRVGGSVGGPIVSDKAFFFTALETTLLRSSEVQTYYVPTRELLAISSPATQAIFDKYPLPTSWSDTDVLIRTVRPFMRSLPSVELPVFALPSGIVPTHTSAGPPQNAALGLTRVDYAAGARTLITVRHAFQYV